ncbi:class I SAM-dependent methyltransferase [Paucidesulfovibrio longus]|uniref:class I SAM-dependent methyltransferase n=1 Tax=Paucidesulfovibrio longus TaxID=889 RepID=UPI0003B6512C|nr:class I SAM-dependent methyltransferase [Paucidesulfovibrio longus]
MNCRFCNTPLSHQFIDLVGSPPSNSFLSSEQLNEPETYYPLKLFVCRECHLVQIDEYKKSDDIFSSEYIYYSSYSTSWLRHAEQYVEMIARRLDLGPQSLVMEIASNDGYLLQYVAARGIPCLGVEPAVETSEVARSKGIEVLNEFFGKTLAARLSGQGRQADLIVGNNVLAHVPDINDFVAGLAEALKPGGTVTMEFPHLMRLVSENQFDTIYHEHFSYLSFHTVQRIFAAHGLKVYDVEELPTHGGSLRVYAGHAENAAQPVGPGVSQMLESERAAGMMEMDYYEGFQAKADKVKHDLLEFLIDARRCGKKVAAYGAAAKGNTLLNYCGVKTDLVSFVVDRSPHKQGKFLPGCHIPVVGEDVLQTEQPDIVLILPWNIKDEIIEQLAYCKKWAAQYAIAIPSLRSGKI